MKVIIEAYLSQAAKAFEALSDNRYIWDNLTEEASNVWSFQYDEEDEEELDKSLDFTNEIQEQLASWGVTDYEIYDRHADY